MPWFNVDDKAHDDDRFRQAGLAAFGLFAAAGSYCMDKLTDGFVPHWFIETWAGGPEASDALIAHGIWAHVDGGYQYVEWKEARTRAAVLARKAKWREEKQRQREKQVSGVDSVVESVADKGKTQVTHMSGADSGADPLVIGYLGIGSTYQEPKTKNQEPRSNAHSLAVAADAKRSPPTAGSLEEKTDDAGAPRPCHLCHNRPRLPGFMVCAECRVVIQAPKPKPQPTNERNAT
jgi:hypothetical protein